MAIMDTDAICRRTESNHISNPSIYRSVIESQSQGIENTTEAINILSLFTFTKAGADIHLNFK